MHKNSPLKQGSATTKPHARNRHVFAKSVTPVLQTMPSGQRVSHYKDFISGLKSFNAAQEPSATRKTLNNSSLLNESYATAITTNMPTQFN